MSQHQLSSNTGLLDARGTAQVLYSLSARFSAVEFADFCTIAEEIVLRDQIILVGKLDKLPKHLRLVLQPLIDAGVFVSLREAFSIPDLPTDPRQLRATAFAIERGLTTATVDDATYEARRLLGGEAHFGVVATPLLRQLQHFGLVRRPCVENTVWDLAAQYHKLSDAAYALRRHLQSIADLPQISIPPIALLAIQRSKTTFERVVHEVLELRDEFSRLRVHLREIEERLREGKLSPSQALELEAAWRQRWEGLAEKLGASGRMAIARTSVPLLRDGIKIVKGVVTQDVADVVAATVAWIGPGVEALGSMQIRPVRRSVSNYLTTSDQDLVRAVARIFDTDFVRLDGDMRALAYQAGSPWRLAIDQATLPPYRGPAPPMATANTREGSAWPTRQPSRAPMAGYQARGNLPHPNLGPRNVPGRGRSR